MNWIFDLLSGGSKKKASKESGAIDQNKKVESDLFKDILNIDESEIYREADNVQRAEEEARGVEPEVTDTFDKKAAYEKGDTSPETVEKDHKLRISHLSDYNLAELLAEYTTKEKQTTTVNFNKEKEKQLESVKSNRQAAEEKAWSYLKDRTHDEWKKTWEKFRSWENKPATEEELYGDDWSKKNWRDNKKDFKGKSDKEHIEEDTEGYGKEEEAGQVGKEASKKVAISVPKDHPVQPLKPGEDAEDKATCNTCGLSWDDSKSTSMTPAPSGRCPFEAFHEDEDEEVSKKTYKSYSSKKKSELTHSDTCERCKQLYPGVCDTCKKNKEVGTYRKDANIGDYLTVDEAVDKILTDKYEVNDVLPNVEEDKRDDVLKKLRELDNQGKLPKWYHGFDKGEQKESSKNVEKKSSSNSDVLEAFINRTNPKIKSGNLYITVEGDSWNLINYRTVIAKHLGDRIAVDPRSYTPTTSKIQSELFDKAESAGIPLHDIRTDELLSPSILEQRRKEKSVEFQKMHPREPYERLSQFDNENVKKADEYEKEENDSSDSSKVDEKITEKIDESLEEKEKQVTEKVKDKIEEHEEEISDKVDKKVDEKLDEAFEKHNEVHHPHDEKQEEKHEKEQDEKIEELIEEEKKEPEHEDAFKDGAEEEEPEVKEIEPQSSKKDVLKKVAEIESPWKVIKNDKGEEVIARIAPPKNNKLSKDKDKLNDKKSKDLD